VTSLNLSHNEQHVKIFFIGKKIHYKRDSLQYMATSQQYTFGVRKYYMDKNLHQTRRRNQSTWSSVAWTTVEMAFCIGHSRNLLTNVIWDKMF